MRHNSSLSYRHKLNFSTAFFAFVLIVFLNCLSFSALAQSSSNGQITQQGQSETKAEEKVPGQAFDERAFGPQVEEESFVWMIIKTIFVLGLFAGGFYLFYKFVTQKAGLQVSGHEAIRILSMVPVGPNKTLQLIDIAGKIYLIGVSESGINLLTEIEAKDEIDRIRLLSSRSTPIKELTFQDFLGQQIGWVIDRVSDIKDRFTDKKSAKGPTGTKRTSLEERDVDLSYLSRQKSRLKKMNGDDEE
ncbi:MAG TPA: flagellar biosynthetic protein FliO [Spirochaetota bacterium]|jgi:flagellar biosynthetic protein FliO|nr:flagellar biosynthetic protein FliO [Spirochaetota bacterium]HON15429.1 flagellar biosynthetic protein FliO [Spirochaetota bacterium]HOV08587.1 flagellar biosynthetic protein FliO [Spirochaetota bacterium]HPD77136.1 flagellar biosynthetic protein FliO [Spirochaetota bacterium]HRS63844.1 flagellar biosynthetic protein FliO [Spirochaetota bacterium]